MKPGFTLTAANAAAIAAICRGLDGLPLALELAAARVRILEPAALLQRLDHALDLLTSGDRDLPLRQRTLRATISWSYSLLDAAEQRLLRRVSVFHEGWTLEAMEQVCYGEAERPRALDELDSLVEKGLVRVVAQGERYSLLETIRAFAAEQLHAGGEVEAVRHAHADCFLAFARGVEGDIKGTAQLEAVRRGRGDNANTHAAIQWLTVCARAGDPRGAREGPPPLRAISTGSGTWAASTSPAGSAVDALLALAPRRLPEPGRARAYLASAMISHHHRRLGPLTRRWEERLRGRSRGRGRGDQRGGRSVFVGYLPPACRTDGRGSSRLDEGIERSAGLSDFLLALSHDLEGHASLRDRRPSGRPWRSSSRHGASRIASATRRWAAWRRASSRR